MHFPMNPKWDIVHCPYDPPNVGSKMQSVQNLNNKLQ